MNVETLRLKNFKRFTDLKIDLSSSAGPAKLVLLIGANGSGKSSVFDAFECLSGPSKGTSVGDQYRNYVDKNEHEDVSVRCSFGGGIVIHRSNHGEVASTSPNWGAQAFYGRSSLRTVPELRYRHEDEIEVASDSDRPQRSIDQDTRFETDIAQITERILREVWGERFDAEIMKARFVDPINDALARVFSNGAATNLRLVRMIPALQGKPPDIRFRKGRSDIHYDLLSSGEKEVFNILVNLFSRREHFANTIYFIDELDVHLHTRLQYALLQEIVEHWIPDHSQLWTASHSLGFIDYANSSDEATVIDFDDLDFDQCQVLRNEIRRRNRILRTRKLSLPSREHRRTVASGVRRSKLSDGHPRKHADNSRSVTGASGKEPQRIRDHQDVLPRAEGSRDRRDSEGNRGR